MRKFVWIELREVLAVHDLLLSLDGGATGLRDMGLLQSALSRPQQLYVYAEKQDIATLAAAYIFGIVGNHPFVDGNKRTGFTLGILFIEINGYKFTASEESATQIILGLAAGKLAERALAQWLRANVKRQRT